MSYLQRIQRALEDRSDIALIGKPEKRQDPIRRRASRKRITQHVVEAWYFRVAPVPRVYDPILLQAFMEGILPGVEPAKKCDFGYSANCSQRLFLLGRIRYTEQLGEQQTIDQRTKTISFSGSWRPGDVEEGTTSATVERTHRFMRDIRIDVFPNNVIADFIRSGEIEKGDYTRINCGNQWALARWPPNSRLGRALRENGN